MNGEDDYLEARAIHLIREAERARAISLDLHEIDSLRRLPPEVNWLRALQTLDLSRLVSLGGDLSPLAGLGRLASEAGFCDSSVEAPVTHE
jgi:hypothetical protein